MSREAADDGGPDVAEEIEPAAMASEGAESGDACVAGDAAEPLDQGEATRGGEGSADDKGDAGAPGILIAMAELAELDEPGPVLPPPRRWPRLLLALGFVLLAAAILGGAVAIVGSVTHGFKKPVKVTYTKSPVFSLKTGDCIDPQGQSYTLISCDSPHEAEVFATFSLAGTTWPGSTKVAAAASSGCSTRLTGYLNPQLAVSLASTYVYPDATAWQAGTRTVICEVRAAGGELTGSVRGATATAG
jgi:Septum formation